MPLHDWILACAGALVSLYGYFFYEKTFNEDGLADDTGKWVTLAGLLLLLEGARRALGPAMIVIASIFLAYVFFGLSGWRLHTSPLDAANAVWGGTNRLARCIDFCLFTMRSITRSLCNGT